jgi:hypothetical protein
MSQKQWGNITWYLFHTLAEKVNSERFNEVKPSIIFFIQETCRNLPCPICSSHAQSNLKVSRLDLIETKADLIEFLRQFHNVVNIHTGKETVSKEFVITKYKKARLIDIINLFIQIFSHKYGNFEVNAFLRANERQKFVNFARKQLNYILKYCY